MIQSNALSKFEQILAVPSVVKAVMSNPKDQSVVIFAGFESAMLVYPTGK
jgi:hypothetical protein